MNGTFNALEIFEMAVKIERNGAKFYRKAAQGFEDPDTRNLLNDLAGMEDEHEKIFAQMQHDFESKGIAPNVFDPEDQSSSYLHAMAEEGFSILRLIPITGFFAWVLWIIEIGIVMYLTVKFGGNVSSMPFCEACNKWAEERTLFTTSNSYDTKMGIVKALADKEYGEIKGLNSSDFNKSNKFEITLSHCGDLSHDGFISLSDTYPKEKKDETETEFLLLNGIVPADGVTTLLNDFSVTNGETNNQT